MKKILTYTMIGITCLFFCFFILPADAFAQSNRGAAAPADILPERLKGQDIKDYFLPASEKEAGVIHRLMGHIIVTHRGSNTSYFGQEGDTIYENDALETLADSRCRLKLFNNDVITMAPDTRFSVDLYQDKKDEGKKKSFFGMLKGKAMFYAMRLLKYKEARFTVKTPTAVAAVRGTKFALHVYDVDENKTARTGIRVADSGNAVGPYLLAATAGNPPPATLATTGDGSVVIKYKVGEQEKEITIYPGEVFRDGAKYYDPNVLRLLENAIAGTLTEEELAEAAEVLAGLPAGSELLDLLDTILQQNTENTLGGSQETLPVLPTGPPTASDFGYFATMMRSQSCGLIEDVFVSKDPNSLSTSPNIADSIIGTGGYLHWDGVGLASNNQMNQNGFFTEVLIGGAEKYPNVATQAVREGYGPWTEWGYWNHAGSFTGSATYEFVQKTWWVQGVRTTSAEMNAHILDSKRFGLVTYADNIVVRGTYYDGVTSTDLNAGRLAVTFDYDNGSVTNFLLEALGGGKGSRILSGTGTVQSDGEFDITGGQWQLNDGDGWFNAMYGEAHGAHFGPHGETVAGSWGAYDDCDDAATGIFRAQNSRIIREHWR